VPPRLLHRSIGLMEAKRFVDWSFGHYLEIAPPEFARPPAGTTAQRLWFTSSTLLPSGSST
jgi:hypothetical protein